MTQTVLQRRLVRLADAINKKAVRLHAPGRVSAESLFLIIRKYPQCPYCGQDTDPMHGSFDHVVPFDKDGTNLSDNIVFAHRTCNKHKHTKSVSEYSSYKMLTVTCPVDGTVFRPRYADYARGLGRYCSRSCSAASRWLGHA
jgi:hypothetical protein